TPNNNVTVTWVTNGNGTRYTGIELFDRNMNFQRQLAHAGGHMDVTNDLNGDEVLLWVASGDPQPLTNCKAGVVKIRLSDAAQTCVWPADWSMGVHVSAPDDSGWVFIENYVPSDPIPPTGWLTYTNEILQVKLDGSEIRRLAHHRSRPLNSYEYQPKTSASRDGTKIVFGSNYGLQKILGYPSLYGDAYMIDVDTSGSAINYSPPSTTTSTPASTPASTPTSTTTTRTEQNANTVTYSGTWYSKNMSANSGGSSVMAMDTGARATFTFNGTSVTFIGYRDAWSGIANIYVDGGLKGAVDTYSAID